MQLRRFTAAYFLTQPVQLKQTETYNVQLHLIYSKEIYIKKLRKDN